MKIGEIYDEREAERAEAYDDGYQQGRADAIEKVKSELPNVYMLYTTITVKEVYEILEQIKEQKND